MSILIQEVPTVDAPMELLLLADPSEDKVRSYLPGSKCFVASRSGVVVGACVVKPLAAGAHELMSIAVQPAHQRLGYGTALLKWVIDFFRKSGASQLEVGTGTFGYQLAFYQKHGFRVSSLDHNFFVKNYPEPIFEDGIQLFDMLRLTLMYPGNVAQPFIQAAAASRRGLIPALGGMERFVLVVIFRARIRAFDAEYSAVAARMRELAMKEFGCIEFHAVTEGRDEVALSYWPSEDAIRAWKAHPEHLLAQEAGRSRWYESYSVQVATVTREYSVAT